jgi:hypothetical protein
MELNFKEMTFKNLLATVRGELPASETVRDLAMQEIERREKAFRKAIEDALAEIEEDERIGYPTATVFENAPLALIQCRLESQRKALKYVLIVLDKKDGAE